MSSSIFKTIDVVFHLKKIEIAFHLKKKIEVVFHISSSLVKIRLHSAASWVALPESGWLSVIFNNKNRLFSVFHLVGLNQCCIQRISSLGCLEQN
jgi:hypothetical protein